MNWQVQVSRTTDTIEVFLDSYDELTRRCLELATLVNENSEFTNKLLRDMIYCSFLLNYAYISKIFNSRQI